MASFPRYAIYFASPQGSDLDRFGAQHLGCDAWTGEDLPFPEDVVRAVPDWRELTEDPRKYGFHGTFKAPMALADGETEAGLLAACADFARASHFSPVIKPVVQLISGFIAVVPGEPSPALQELAAACVRAFDSFRAPLTPEDRARRNPSKLNARQIEYLDSWGYPYVMEEFRFHMTLTGRLVPARREAVLAFLQKHFSGIGLAELAIDSIALFRQTVASSRFRVIEHWPLRKA